MHTDTHVTEADPLADFSLIYVLRFTVIWEVRLPVTVMCLASKSYLSVVAAVALVIVTAQTVSNMLASRLL